MGSTRFLGEGHLVLISPEESFLVPNAFGVGEDLDGSVAGSVKGLNGNIREIY